jgi:dTDP-4-amino-4,6-dideoxygalactose transaminase
MLTYPEPVHRIPQLKGHFVGQEFAAAARMSLEILSLPVHPLLSDRDRQRIEALILSVSSCPPL